MSINTHKPSVFVEHYHARIFFKDTQKDGAGTFRGNVLSSRPGELKQHERNARVAQLLQMVFFHSGSRDVNLTDASLVKQVPNWL